VFSRVPGEGSIFRFPLLPIYRLFLDTLLLDVLLKKTHFTDYCPCVRTSSSSLALRNSPFGRGVFFFPRRKLLLLISPVR